MRFQRLGCFVPCASSADRTTRFQRETKDGTSVAWWDQGRDVRGTVGPRTGRPWHGETKDETPVARWDQGRDARGTVGPRARRPWHGGTKGETPVARFSSFSFLGRCYIYMKKINSNVSSERNNYSVDPISPEWDSLKKYRGGRLPHWNCNNAVYHLCFRLADAVPPKIQQKWREERNLLQNTDGSPRRGLFPAEYKRTKFLLSRKIEDCLDAGYGECLLKKPDIAKIMRGAIEYFDGGRYKLHAWCIMPNHVHAIAEPFAGFELSQIVHSWKSFTAKKINRELGRTGSVWQQETYDHIIRSKTEYLDLMDYVWNNPVKAGLRDCPKWRIDLGTKH